MGMLKEGEDWELGGVFSTQEKALGQCTTEDDYVFPIILDDYAGRETVDPHAYFPIKPGDETS